jgi:hypothetical protein
MEIADQGVRPSLNHSDTKTGKNYRLNYQPFMSNGLTTCSAPIYARKRRNALGILVTTKEWPHQVATADHRSTYSLDSSSK